MAENQTCPRCEGDRHEPGYQGMPAEDGGPGPCTTCNGKGEVRVCPHCEGQRGDPEWTPGPGDTFNGVVEPGQQPPCPACNGEGVAPIPDPISYMDMASFQEDGYLQEANRRFFHPLGLALEWTGGLTKEWVRKTLENAGVQFGEEAQDHIWTFIRTAGLDQPHISGVWDYRHDPEGMEFGWDHMDHDEVMRKYEHVKQVWHEHIPARRARFGDNGMEQQSASVTSIQALPRRSQVHSSSCGLGPNHEGGCLP